jgi:hypothetical protein
MYERKLEEKKIVVKTPNLNVLECLTTFYKNIFPFLEFLYYDWMCFLPLFELYTDYYRSGLHIENKGR